MFQLLCGMPALVKAKHDRLLTISLRGKACNEGEVLISLGKLVPPARFQRATFRLGGGRSMQLSYGSTGMNPNREVSKT